MGWNGQSGSGQRDLLESQPAPEGQSRAAGPREGVAGSGSDHLGSSGQPRPRGVELILPLHGRAECILRGGGTSTGPFWIPPTISSV